MVDISSFVADDKKECVAKLNNNFDPKNLADYHEYVDFADLFGTGDLAYKPDEKTWKAMRSYLAFFKDGADYRDWDAFVEYAVLFRDFTNYAIKDDEHILPEMRRF